MRGNVIPLVPGMLSTHHREMSRPDFRKRQILEQMAVGKATGLESPAATAVGVFASKLSQVRSGELTHGSNPTPSANVAHTSPQPAAGIDKGRSSSTKYRVDTTQPTWVTHDRQVLRFFGYFQEKVLEAGRETLRTRRVVLCYYLSDSALSISEPRVANSGLAQGEFMKRTVATKADGNRFAPLDLRVGGVVKLYGRTLHLTDCDAATRTFYDEALGVALDAPLKYPDDATSQLDEIDAIKQRLRAKTAAAAESKAEAARKFQENSHKVLRFFVSWRDPHPLYPETRRFVLHYYLSDDTIEVVEPKESPVHHEQRERVGHHHFGVLISRQRVLKNDTDVVLGSGALVFGDRTHGKQLLTDRDLRCGEWAHLLSRAFFLEDCDPFTRNYYLETHGVTQERCEPEQVRARVAASKWKLFQAQPDNGSAATSISSAMLHRLDAHVQDNQTRKLQDASLDKKQLRFRARFHGLDVARDPNAKREFTLTYFLEDDTLAVFEPRMKNSGVAGGRFLDRGRFRKCQDAVHGGTSSRELQKDRSAYHGADFYVGAIVRFEFSPHQSLELLAADEQTLSYCESHSESFPFSDARAVLDAMAKTLLQKKSGRRGGAESVRRECRALDPTNSHVLETAACRRVLDECGLLSALNAQQVLTLSRKFAADVSSQSTGGNSASGLGMDPPALAYDDVCDALAFHTMALTGSTMTRTTSSSFPSSQQLPADSGLSKLAKVPHLRKLLRQADPQRAQTVPGDVLLRVVNFYRVGLSSSDLEALVRRFSRNGAVEYHKLCDSVFQTPPSTQSLSSSDAAQYSLRKTDNDIAQSSDDGDEFGFSDGDDGEQHCEPPVRSPDVLSSHQATTRTAQAVPAALHLRTANALPTPRSTTNPAERARTSDPRVVAILKREFGECKYQLRRALRERDTNKSGRLDEEAFMDALVSIAPALSDADSYAIADAYFPTNNCQVDYAQLLESAFRG